MSVGPGRVKLGIRAPSLLESESGEFEFVDAEPIATTVLRPFGLAAGAFVVPEDFDSPLSDEILRSYEEG